MASEDIGDLVGEVIPCLVIPDSQTEASDLNQSDKSDERVKRLQTLMVLGTTSPSPILNPPEAAVEGQQKMLKMEVCIEEEDEDVLTQDDLFQPKHQEQISMTNRVVCTPSATVASLHLSQGDVPETTSDETAESSTVLSDEAVLVNISSSPSEVGDRGVSSTQEITENKGKTTACEYHENDVELPAWQQALNKQQTTSCDSSTESSKTKSFSNSDSASEGVHLQSAQQSCQDIQPHESGSNSAQIGSVNMQSIHSNLPGKSVEKVEKMNQKSVEDSVEQKGRKMGETTLSQEWSLHFTPSQSEPESQGAVVVMETILKKSLLENQEENKQKPPTKGETKNLSYGDNDSVQMLPESPIEAAKEIKTKTTVAKISDQLQKPFSSPRRNQRVALVFNAPVCADEIQMGQTPTSRGDETGNPQSVSSAAVSTGRPSDDGAIGTESSDTSFHLNVPNEGSGFHQERIAWFLEREGTGPKAPRHSTPIGDEETDKQEVSVNQRKETIATMQSSKSVLTVGNEDAAEGTMQDDIFHLEIPSSTKEELKFLKQSPFKKKSSVFTKVQEATTSSIKTLHVHFTKEADPDTQGEENLFTVEKQGKPSSRNSSTDTIPVDYSGETERYDQNFEDIDTQRTSNQTELRENNIPHPINQTDRTPPVNEGLNPTDVLATEANSYTGLRDPYEFTDSQSSRTPANLKYPPRKPTKSSEENNRKKTLPDVQPIKDKILKSNTRTTKSRSVKAHTPQRKRPGPKSKTSGSPKGSDKSSSGTKEKPKPAQFIDSSKEPEKSAHRKQSSSSSGEGRDFPEEQEESPNALQVIKYFRVPVWLRRKEVYENGVLVAIDESEIKRGLPLMEKKEESYLPPLSPPKSTSSLTSGSLADISSVGSRSSSNTSSLQKSLSITSSKSSANTSGKSDSSFTKTPSPIASSSRLSLTRTSSIQQIVEEPSATAPSLDNSAAFKSINKDTTEKDLPGEGAKEPETKRTDTRSSVGKELAESVHAQIRCSDESSDHSPRPEVSRNTPEKKKRGPAEKRSTASPASKILQSPPKDSTTVADNSLDASIILSLQTRILTQWKDGFFYPGRVTDYAGSERYLIEFDDGDFCEKSRSDIITKAWLSKGQAVLAKEESSDYFKPGKIVGYYQDKKAKESGYVIENVKNETHRIPRKNVILSKEQGGKILTSSSSNSGASSGDISLGNILSGKRRSRTSVTPESASVPSSAKGENTPSEAGASSTPRSSVKRKLLPTKGKSDKGVPAKKKLALPRSPAVCPSPDVGVAVRRSPRKRGPGSSSEAPPNKFLHSETQEDTAVHMGPFPKSNTLFKGLAFLITEGKPKPNIYDFGQTSDDTCPEEQPLVPFRREYAVQQIQKGGGIVLKDFEKSQISSLTVFLIANTYCRTRKYFQALAAGIPCINHLWLRECCKTNQLVDEKPYYLPAGESLEEDQDLDNAVEWQPNRPSVLKGKRMMVVSDHVNMRDVWRPILMAAGCHMVTHPAAGLDSQESSTPYLCDYIVSDPTCPKHVLRKADDLGIPVVSCEWVIQCLINGRIVRHDSHLKYHWSYREKPV